MLSAFDRLIRPHTLETVRTMATSRPAKYHFLFVVPDKPNTLAKRLEVRP